MVIAPIYTPPAATEYAPYYAGYVEAAGSGDVLELLSRQIGEVTQLTDRLPAGQGDYAYAPGKWTIKEVLGHLNDTERVFGYRALRIARADSTPLPGFDENAWMPWAGFQGRTLGDLGAEFRAVREASLALFRHFDREAVGRSGTASGKSITVRALVYITAGHVQHHLRVLRERYGV
jgi:hypothetical protein